MNRLSINTLRRRRFGFASSSGGRARRAKAPCRRSGSMIEVLEDRTLLSTLDITAGALTYDGVASASDLTVSTSGPGGHDTFTDTDQLITLTAAAMTAGWSGSGTNTVTGLESSVSSMAITNSSSAGQSLTLLYTGGDPLPASGLIYDPTAATGPATNTLTLESGTGGTTFTSETYTATGAGAGTITYTDSTHSNVPIAFSNLSPVNDTVPSPTFTFDAPAAGTTVNVVNGPIVGTTQTDQINDGGTGTFELINFGNKTTATANVNNHGATTTVDTTTAAAGLSTLNVNSGAGADTIDVEATPSGVTTTTDTGSVAGSTTNVGLAGVLSSILGPVFAKSTGGSNTLAINDSGEGTAETYTIAGSRVIASSFPTFIDFSGGGITTLDLKTTGDATVNFTGPVQSAVTKYNITGGTTLSPNTLDVTSSVSSLSYSTAGTLGFGTGAPTISYTNFATVNVTKPATPPTGTAVTFNATAGQPLNNVVVATFTETDLANTTANFTASINWGDGSTATPGTISLTGATTYDILGSHTYATSGTYTVNVTLTDLSTSGTTTVGSTTINVISNGPQASTPSPIVSTADVAPQIPTNSVMNLKGSAISAVQDVETTQDVATFNSTYANAVPSDFTATINWGDGTPTTAGTITEDANNLFHVTGTHTYTKAGSFTPTVTIKDINGTLYETGVFNQTNLVSSVSGMAAVVDSNLINPWGMSSSATSPIWVSDQGTGVSTLYNPNGSPIKQALTVTIPAIGTPSGPTGQVHNSDTTTTDFTIPGPGGTSVPSVFLFASLDGTIAGWNPGSTGGTTSALTAATVPGAAFTGLAQASVTTPTTTFYLYAADFTGTTGANGIDVFDPTFTNVSATTFAGKFTDPNAVAGYLPYNIALLNGNLYVAYAQPSGIVTTGGGYIDEFDTSGNFINRIYTDTAGTNLKGPWGMAIAPSGFGTFGGDLLVGNFGNATATSPNGTIIAITLPTSPGTPGTLAGTLSTPNGPIANAGQWSLLFGNGGSGGTSGALYFSAGIDGQTQGLFGEIAFAATPAVTVAAAPLDAQGTTIRGIEGNSLGATAGASDVLVATFLDTGTPGAASSYTATINWGDGTTATADTRITSQGTPDGTVFSVYGDHTYPNVGTYPVTVTITNTANGAIAVASSQAVIADAALSLYPPQPTVSTTEDVAFSGAVASFSDADPGATITDYTYVTIDWGDGTPQTAGTVSGEATPGGSPNAFFVSGTHTYADAGVNGGIGHYPITVNVHDMDGSTLTITNTANVADVALTVTGKLNPASDSGASNSDDITNVVQPNFLGTTNQPDATVTLYATASGSTTAILIGQGVSNANDAWSITSNQALANGSYTITAIAVDSSGHTVSPTTTIVSALVIDTVGPKVTSVQFNRFQGQIQVTFQDYGGLNNAGVGLNMATVIDANNYQLTTVHHPRVGKYRVNVISDVPGTTSGTQVATLSINGGKYIRGGWYFFTIHSVSPTDLSGVKDIAGNALDGEFYGYFPSGNNHSGGDFVAQLTAIHHTIFAPSTVIGRATPVSPPGTLQGNTIVSSTFNPSKLPHVRATDPKAKAKTKTARHDSAKRVHHATAALLHRTKEGAAVSVTAANTTASPPPPYLSMQAVALIDAALHELHSHRSLPS